MKTESIITHITPVGGNLFVDLGFDEDEAEDLLAETDAIISEKLAIKDYLMSELAVWIEAKELQQAEAAEILGITGPRVSDIFHRKASKFTIDALVDMLTRAGKHVRLSVQ